MNSISKNAFVNKDEIAVHFDLRSNYTVSEEGANNLSVCCGSPANKRRTVCIAVSADGTKLPLFVIYKGAVSGSIANSSHQILPSGMHGCTQPKGRMDNRVME